ncbi:hypothetical protein [Streptomyces agglomeratus]|uniref:hypothetical protein n=1 Tax=Streptomyces agglomeratus TaxID=285458 RepID=UPI00114C9984|nr:hypothetical protein [Streptomyces agglomeratus]
MATVNQGGVALRSDRRLLLIVWFTGAAVLLYLFGNEYELSEELAVWHQHAFTGSLIGLSVCLVGSAIWPRTRTIRAFFAARSLKLLDVAVRAIEALKKWLGGGRASNGDPGRNGPPGA